MDKFLWAVRLYKTRSLAAAACTGGKVHINGQAVKPSRPARPGEVITAVSGVITRTVKVLGVIDHRVGARLVPQYLEDLTPASEYNKPKDLPPPGYRPKGSGRPTKRDRRILHRFFE